MTDIHLPTFKTKRLTLRHLTEDDFAFMRELDPHTSEAETLKTMQRIFANYEVFEMGMMIVEDSLSHELLGKAGLIPRNSDDGLVWEIVFAFKASAQGKGFATEVATYLMNWGIENLETDYLVMFIPSDNLDAVHVANKVGLNHWRDESIDNIDYSIYRTL